MDDEADRSYFKAQIRNSTLQALCLVFINHPEIEMAWVPRSLCEWHQQPGRDGVGTIVIESWKAKEIGLE